MNKISSPSKKLLFASSLAALFATLQSANAVPTLDITVDGSSFVSVPNASGSYEYSGANWRLDLTALSWGPASPDLTLHYDLHSQGAASPTIGIEFSVDGFSSVSDFQSTIGGTKPLAGTVGFTTLADAATLFSRTFPADPNAAYNDGGSSSGHSGLFTAKIDLVLENPASVDGIVSTGDSELTGTPLNVPESGNTLLLLASRIFAVRLSLRKFSRA